MEWKREKFTAKFNGGINQIWSEDLGSFSSIGVFFVKELVESLSRARSPFTSEAPNGSWSSASHLKFSLSSDQVSRSLSLSACTIFFSRNAD